MKWWNNYDTISSDLQYEPNLNECDFFLSAQDVSGIYITNYCLSMTPKQACDKVAKTEILCSFPFPAKAQSSRLSRQP